MRLNNRVAKTFQCAKDFFLLVKPCAFVKINIIFKILKVTHHQGSESHRYIIFTARALTLTINNIHSLIFRVSYDKDFKPVVWLQNRKI